MYIYIHIIVYIYTLYIYIPFSHCIILLFPQILVAYPSRFSLAGSGVSTPEDQARSWRRPEQGQGRLMIRWADDI